MGPAADSRLATPNDNTSRTACDRRHMPAAQPALLLPTAPLCAIPRAIENRAGVPLAHTGDDRRGTSLRAVLIDALSDAVWQHRNRRQAHNSRCARLL